MKIKVKIGKEREDKHGLKRGIRRIYLALPNSFIKSRLAVKIIRNGLESKAEENGNPPVISPDFITRDRLKTFYKCLKGVIKQNGHFNLVEVHSSDGTKVIIRI